MDSRERGASAQTHERTSDGNLPEGEHDTEQDVRLPPLSRFGRRVNRAFHRRMGRRSHDPAGVDVVAEDWDLLVVLDACRADTFEAVNDLPGECSRRRSRGSHTVEFLWGNFVNRELHDTVYVTANVQPYVFREYLDLHHVEHAWVDGFDEERRTVPPDAVTDAALGAAERFPHKRLVVHYLQPHYPFLDGPSFPYGTMAFWDAVAAGAVDCSSDRLRDLHRTNLARVLQEVERLREAVEGGLVVSSDHGTALGERAAPVPTREWGHPWGVYIEPLVTVPWLTTMRGDRRQVVAEQSVETADYDDDAIEAQLDALGYL